MRVKFDVNVIEWFSHNPSTVLVQMGVEGKCL